MTLCSFCHYINETLLQQNVLEPGFPRKIGLETARTWLHELGFSKIEAKKGTYCMLMAMKEMMLLNIEVNFYEKW